MIVRLGFGGLLTLLLIAPSCFAQDPLPVLSSKWRFAIQKAPKAEAPTPGPARALTDDDKNFQRKVRELRTDHPPDPNEMTPDGRRAALDKIDEEANTRKAEDAKGYSYIVQVRNDSAKTVKVVFWEYRFTELARPENVIRRQFLCAVNLKKGETMELSAFSLLGPSEVISADSLAQASNKMFDERVQVNRIEFSDDTILQRGNWKYNDIRSAVDRLTSTPWGKEVCRPL